jgi:hypothetical protein
MLSRVKAFLVPHMVSKQKELYVVINCALKFLAVEKHGKNNNLQML